MKGDFSGTTVKLVHSQAPILSLSSRILGSSMSGGKLGLLLVVTDREKWLDYSKIIALA